MKRAIIYVTVLFLIVLAFREISCTRQAACEPPVGPPLAAPATWQPSTDWKEGALWAWVAFTYRAQTGEDFESTYRQALRLRTLQDRLPSE